jgi:AcrR family transcriptional regulator
MTSINSETEQKILRAAMQIFSIEGFKGARMQEIADKAGINKALLHYYYRNKETLYKASFDTLTFKIFTQVNLTLHKDAPLFTKIENIVAAYIDLIVETPEVPQFILNGIINNQDELIKNMQELPLDIKPFMQQIQNEILKGNIKPIHPAELLINILSLSIFPFAARPVITNVVGKNIEFNFDEFIKSRKKTIPEFIINAIKVEK